jgi:hypothetical protein
METAYKLVRECFIEYVYLKQKNCYETVCDKGTTFLRNRNSDNIESNTKTLYNENETRLLRKIVYGV